MKASTSVCSTSVTLALTNCGGVVGDVVGDAVGKRLASRSIAALTPSPAASALAPGSLVDADHRGRLAVEARGDVGALGAEFDLRHVADAHERAVGFGAQHDIRELGGIGQPPLGCAD